MSSPYGYCLWCFEPKPAADCTDTCSETCRNMVEQHDHVLEPKGA